MLSCGGNLILSPAATSFDKYENFAERGDDFKRIVLGKKKK
jgi:UDP-N-acetylmuramoylalanine-D-glutamate ligase